MLIKDKIGNINSFKINGRVIDTIAIEWYEARSRIMHKRSQLGEQVVIKFLQSNPDLKEGDILWCDDNRIITVEIKPCKAIIIRPENILEAANIAFEIGNKHLPLFYEKDELLIPYDEPLYNLLKASGYIMKIEDRQLDKALKTSVSPHAHQGNGTSLFSKILTLTSSS